MHSYLEFQELQDLSTDLIPVRGLKLLLEYYRLKITELSTDLIPVRGLKPFYT